jgi:manganese-dependent inorganic pyrophosphatase
MFACSSDLSLVAANEIVSRDAKDYDTSDGQTVRIAQVETVGQALTGRRDEIMSALEAVHQREGYLVVALMVTDIVGKGTQLYATGDRGVLKRAFDDAGDGGPIDLPGVMSRKKQVAPNILGAVVRPAAR